MKLLVAIALIGLVAGKAVNDLPFDSPIELDYHNKIGIPLATRIKAAEEARDFDGARIVGGSPASLGQFRHIGGLVVHLSTGQTSLCGSSLLSNTRALTAAHCWRTFGSETSSFTVVFESTLLFSGGTRIPTSDVEMHTNYNMATLANDIAIIRLPWVTYNNNVQPIAIAVGSDSYAGSWGWVAGWGLTADGAGIPVSQFLAYVDVAVISNSQCAQTFGSIVLDSTLCVATTNARGPCTGDSGGPLTNAANNLLIGVVSFGHSSGCQASQPAGFARVTAYTAWIQARL